MKVFSTKKYFKWVIDNKNYNLIIDSIKLNCKRKSTPWWIACDGLTKEQMIFEGYAIVDAWFVKRGNDYGKNI